MLATRRASPTRPTSGSITSKVRPWSSPSISKGSPSPEARPALPGRPNPLTFSPRWGCRPSAEEPASASASPRTRPRKTSTLPLKLFRKLSGGCAKSHPFMPERSANSAPVAIASSVWDHQIAKNLPSAVRLLLPGSEVPICYFPPTWEVGLGLTPLVDEAPLLNRTDTGHSGRVGPTVLRHLLFYMLLDGS